MGGWLLNESMNYFLAEVKNHNLSTNTEITQNAWDRAQSAIIAAGSRVLGVYRGGRVIDKEIWWWNDKMQEVTR